MMVHTFKMLYSLSSSSYPKTVQYAILLLYQWWHSSPYRKSVSKVKNFKLIYPIPVHKFWQLFKLKGFADYSSYFLDAFRKRAYMRVCVCVFFFFSLPFVVQVDTLLHRIWLLVVQKMFTKICPVNLIFVYWYPPLWTKGNEIFGALSLYSNILSTLLFLVYLNIIRKICFKLHLFFSIVSDLSLTFLCASF